ncbi:hypothetical protein [Streptosporangium sp. NPDC000396]|uniref:hypothetical protein n=1 Tax=Streptosporangium sp. NPDC000396 TaxID=3366185 RepID=UPI0036BE7D5E
MNTNDQLIANLARVQDENLSGQASGAGARTLLDEIVATGPATQQRRRRFLPGLTSRRLVIAAAVTMALAGTFVVAPTLFKVSGQVYANQAVTVDRDGDEYVFYVTDTKPEDLQKAFRELGLNVSVTEMPVSPQDDRDILGVDKDPDVGKVSFGSTGCAYRVKGCTSTFRVPVDLKGHVKFQVPRPAKPGEKYAYPADPSWQGEAMAGVDLTGRSVAEAVKMVRDRDLRVAYELAWRLPEGQEGERYEQDVPETRIDPGWKVQNAGTYNDGVIILTVTPGPGATPPPGY